MRVTEMGARGKENGLAIEILQNIVTVKALGAAPFLIKRWSSRLSSALSAESSRAYVAAFQDVITTLFQLGTPWTLVLIGCSFAASKHMSLGTLLAASALAMQAVGPYTNLLLSVQQLSLLKLDLSRILDVTSAAPESSNSGLLKVPLKGRIDVSNVSFRYNKESPYVLQRISFTIGPGESLGIVGKSGSGKSSLLQLILGFYAPSSGSILIDGRPIASYDLDYLRTQLGVVLQNNDVFASTIKGNLELRTGPVARQILHDALKLSGLDTFVESLPMKEHTFITHSSVLSGGERQRIVIARALINNPRIILFDEATSHLDSHTEAAISDSIASLAATQIVVAHRLSTVHNCTRIIVLDKGTIVEEGNHLELLNKRGPYWSLHQLQYQTNEV